MSNPSIVSGTSKFVQTSMGIPTSAVGNPATWAGNSMPPNRVFPLLTNQSYSAQGNGRFDLTETATLDPRYPRGPRMAKDRGTIDVWLEVGSGAADFLLLQTTPSSSELTLGLNASGQLTGSLENESTTTVAAFVADALDANAGTVHVEVAWDSLVPIDGTRHVKVRVNGRAMPVTDFSTDPVAPWVALQPTFLATGTFVDTFDGEVHLVQTSLTVDF